MNPFHLKAGAIFFSIIFIISSVLYEPKIFVIIFIFCCSLLLILFAVKVYCMIFCIFANLFDDMDRVDHASIVPYIGKLLNEGNWNHFHWKDLKDEKSNI